MENTIADSILGNRSKQQPVERLTGPPLAGPGSGHAPRNIPGVIKSEDSVIDLCVNLPAFLQRAQYKSYLGAAATGVGSTYNYAYALADTVPQGRYWVLLYASVAVIGTGTEAFPGLWMLPPGNLPAPNIAAFQDNPLIFADLEAAAGEIANGPPVLQGVRIDDADYVSAADGNGVKKYTEQAMLRTRNLIIPANWTLMAYGGGAGFGNGGSLAEQFRLNIVFAEFLLREDTEVQ